jgi:hypothetical protein
MKEATKHTPGWTQGGWTAAVGETATVRDVADNQIAIFTYMRTRTGGRRDPDEVEANCRLAASAPDLAEALAKISEWAEHTGRAEYDQKDAIERLNICKELARSALARVRGQE